MSEKNRDHKDRWRNVTVAFRLSPEENEELTNRVKLSGCKTRQEYIIQSILHQKVVATGNPLMLVTFRKNLQHIESELARLEKVGDMDEELFTPIRSMLEILEAFQEAPRSLAGIIHCDETPVQVLKEEGKKPQTKRTGIHQYVMNAFFIHYV